MQSTVAAMRIIHKVRGNISRISFYFKEEIVMKYAVNENCIGCGLCVNLCPAVFEMTDGGTAKTIDTDIPADSRTEANEAMENCPVDAIEEAH